jgi:hypothetical protein
VILRRILRQSAKNRDPRSADRQQQETNFTVVFSHFTERRIILQHKSDLSARWNLTVHLPEAAGSDPTMNPAKSRFSLLTIPSENEVSAGRAVAVFGTRFLMAICAMAIFSR